MGVEVGGLLGILILIADVWAIANVLGSSSSLPARIIWSLLIVFLPIVGLLAWLVAGPRARSSTI